MLNQKDISTWNSADVQNWLKSINMTQYLSKFESNKINGYDLIYLTKEDLKSLGIISIHDKNIILNSMKDALLQELKLNVNFKDKNITIQLDFDPNFTVEQLTNALKLIFKPISSIFLVANNNEILMPNLKIIDLILYNPKIYKNFKIMLDNQLINSNPTFPIKDYSNNNDLLNNKPITSIPPKSSNTNKKKYENYYKINVEENYNTGNTNTNPFSKTDFNNKNEKYPNTFITLDNNEFNKNYLEKNDKFNNKYNANNKNNNNNELKYNNEEPIINKYKTYGDFIKSNNLKNTNFNTDLDNKNINFNNYEKIESKRDLKNKNNNETMGININKDYNINNNNNIYDYNRNITPNQNETRRTKTLSTYRKKYSIENGELNLVEENKIKGRINNNNNLKYGTFNKEEDDDNQKFSSEKRNFRNSEFNFNENNNIDNDYVNKNNYNYKLNNGFINRNNYEFNSLIPTKDKVNDKMNNTSGFNDFRQYNNANDFGLKYN